MSAWASSRGAASSFVPSRAEAEPPLIDVYLEIGSKKTFACAVDWPGWCRSGPNEAAALRGLLDSARAYAVVMRSARLGFKPPTALGQLRVIERLTGNATTDFGAPGVIPSADRAPADEAACNRLERVIRAGWRALDAARRRAAGKALRKGPRGGGRELDGILRHVLEADRGYLNALGWPVRVPDEIEDPLEDLRHAILEGLRAAGRGEIAPKGPRGGTRWPVRYFVRRAAWHTIAHAWEIERRILPG
jgi:hypothetical protein